MGSSKSETIEAANRALLVDGDLDAVDQFFSDGYVAHVTGQDLRGGHAAIREVLQATRKAFPELEVTVEILLEGDDRVAWQRLHRGAHQAAYGGFPGSGREVVWRDLVVSRFDGDRIAEEWVVTDLAERLLRSRKG
ncbi:MAG: hypothetical protein DWQ36_08260 [Acidobacteria bacterium]|nr:MAG: hypothetical protein DWQ30_01985 [Acidobacteriota bacterium]REK08801.1 MAG: hypothetical protein DWQ36_08260 [Acidobacteriota bacterium]